MPQTLEQQLLQMNVLTPEQLGQLRQKAQESGVNLASYIKKEGGIAEETLARAYAQMLSVPLIERIDEQIAVPSVLGKVPYRFLKDNVIIPVARDGKLTLVAGDPENFQAVDQLRILLEEPAPLAISTPRAINEGINRYYPLEGTKQMLQELGQEQALDESVEFGEIDERDILGMAQEAPIIKLVNQLLFQAIKRGASDIHIEPLEKEMSVRLRVDGVLQHAFSPPKRIQAALVSRIKIMANLNIAEKRKPQDGRIQVKVADKPIDVRVSILPTIFGEKVELRLLDKSRGIVALEDLNFNKRDLEIVLASIAVPNGIIMLTGPTGSGKTTTLYAILNRLNSPDVSIVTVEDPVEYQMNGIAQVQVSEKAGLTFATALRSILRQDPDIIMIGEMRDQETAQIAIQASLTGHLVLTTLHTNNAPASITRLIDMGVEPFLIASSMTCIIAQRLVRKVCPACRKIQQPTTAMLAALGLSTKQAAGITFYEAVGCSACSNTGYHGRLAIFEVMRMSDEIARLTVVRADAKQISKAALEDGMTTLLQDGVNKIAQGLTTIDEVLSAASGATE